MPYSGFTLPDFVERFGITVVEEHSAFASVPPVPAVSDIVKTLLAEVRREYRVYNIDELERIVGILVAMVRQTV